MGFYLRKSVKVGPFRFNLSNSGIGVSTGIKGLRVGTGPRGNYVQMGRGGIYFRQTIPSADNRTIPPTIPQEQSSGIDFREIESGSVSQMVDSSSSELLAEINTKAKKAILWPWVLGFSICLIAALVFMGSPIWLYFIINPLCAGGVVWAVYADRIRKTVVLFYELEPHIEEAYQNLHHSLEALQNCSRMWHVESRGEVTTTYDWKVNAGASAVVKRKHVKPHFDLPSYFACNVSIPTLPAGRQQLYFFPDRVLVWDTDGVGSVAYEQLTVNFGERRFIEDGGVPSDSRVVGSTWKYVNKKGGPDKRFNDNREIPIALYEEVLLSSGSGLRELFQLSRIGLGVRFESGVKQMAFAISQRGQPEVEPGYIKCPCNHCEVYIEFPAHGLGQSIVCPHCGMETLLFKPGFVEGS